MVRLDHFQLKTLAHGVYAAIAIEGQSAHSNAGIIDLGGKTLVFDTFTTPLAASILKKTAEELTGHPVKYVINSHAHTDHWCGNQVFAPQALIIATHDTRKMMSLGASNFASQLVRNPTPLTNQILLHQRRLRHEPDPRKQKNLITAMSMLEHVTQSLSSIDLCLPQLTFESKLLIHGTDRIAEINCFGAGHTASDAFLLLPADKILFTGDLACIQTHPFLGSSAPPAWNATLKEMEKLFVEIVVPGHGPLGNLVDLARMREYLSVLKNLALCAIESNSSAQESARQPIPEQFSEWSCPLRFESNMRFLFRYLSQG